MPVNVVTNSKLEFVAHVPPENFRTKVDVCLVQKTRSPQQLPANVLLVEKVTNQTH